MTRQQSSDKAVINVFASPESVMSGSLIYKYWCIWVKGVANLYDDLRNIEVESFTVKRLRKYISFQYLDQDGILRYRCLLQIHMSLMIAGMPTDVKT